MIMKTDNSGKDAIWLQDSSSVWTMGHTSLLIQQTKSRWWYFYWGDYSVQLIYVGNPTPLQLDIFLRSHYYIDANGKKVSLYTGALFGLGTFFNRRLYFQGDFIPSLRYIYRILLNKKRLTSVIVSYKNGHPNPRYFLVGNNCMQVSVDILLKGNFRFYNWVYRRVLIRARSLTVPNIAYRTVSTIHYGLTGMHPSYFIYYLEDYLRY